MSGVASTRFTGILGILPSQFKRFQNIWTTVHYSRRFRPLWSFPEYLDHCALFQEMFNIPKNLNHCARFPKPLTTVYYFRIFSPRCMNSKFNHCKLCKEICLKGKIAHYLRRLYPLINVLYSTRRNRCVWPIENFI